MTWLPVYGNVPGRNARYRYICTNKTDLQCDTEQSHICADPNLTDSSVMEEIL